MIFLSKDESEKPMKSKIQNVLSVIGIISIVFIIIPIAMGLIISIDGPVWLETENEWIGFWGGYAGAILGGLITLFVMWRTIKSSEEILKIDKKQNFVDELLAGFIEYHVVLMDSVGKMSRNELIGDDIARNLSIKSEILGTMLESKKNNPNYYHCNEMLECLNCVTEKFNNIIKFRNTHDIEEHCNVLYEDAKTELAVFLDNVQIFYSENSI